MATRSMHSHLREHPRKILSISIGLVGLFLLSNCAVLPQSETLFVPSATSAMLVEVVPSASTPPQGDFALHITPATVRPGEVISIHGSGFQPEEVIMVVIHAAEESYLYGAQALQNGEYMQEIVLLETLPTGIAVTIEAEGQDSGRQLNGEIQTTYFRNSS